VSEASSILGCRDSFCIFFWRSDLYDFS